MNKTIPILELSTKLSDPDEIIKQLIFWMKVIDLEKYQTNDGYFIPIKIVTNAPITIIKEETDAKR